MCGEDRHSTDAFGVGSGSATTHAPAIIGPRTIEPLEGRLAAADVSLDQAALDRIDEIVAPGITVNPVDNSFANPALEPAARRR